MRIAVALCTYNGAAHLREQLRSIVAQTVVPDEIVVTDDGSTDATMAILEGELADAPFALDCARNTHTKGVAANFADTLARCTADVIALADQDDVWAPTRIEIGTAPFSSPAVMATFSDAELIDGHGEARNSSLWAAHGLGRRARRRLTGGEPWRQLLRWNCATGATLAIRREVLDVALPVPQRTLHDEWLALVAAGLGEVVAIGEPLVSYRVHEGSALGLPPRGRAAVVSRRDDRSTRGDEADRFAELASRLATAGATARAAEARAKAVFAAQRAALGDSPRTRAAAVAADLGRGRYHRFAHGLRSAGHDLVFGT